MTGSRQLVCGHCGQINRLPAGHGADHARCGACHQALFSGRPIEVDEKGFERHLANSDIPLLVDVWAPWCGPCRAMAPMFERAAAELEPEVRLLKLNSDTAPAVSSRLNISAHPDAAADAARSRDRAHCRGDGRSTNRGLDRGPAWPRMICPPLPCNERIS